ncbi:MAG: hypothetical protein DYG96_05350 [Chlorobi bacterium CHB2]|nr:hypothetical protein [Chlorobi bacterium CHB2]
MNLPLRLSAALLALALAFAVSIPAVAQNGTGIPRIDYSLSNEFRYGIGERYEGENPFRKEYLENLFNTRFFVGDFTLGFRAQIDKPREYGRDTIGIKEYYAEFRRDGISARAGNFYNLIGRGLVMNSFESRPIGFDAPTLGVKLGYDDADFSAQAFGGLMDFADILSNTRVEQYLLRGASGEVRPTTGVGVGGSYLAVSGQRTPNGFRRPFDSYLREIFTRLNYKQLSAYLNYADKRNQISDFVRQTGDSNERGNGWYGMLGYTGEMLSVTAQYKSYQFDLVKPSFQATSDRQSRALPFQNAPTLVPEYSKALLDRNPHAVDFSDEVGFMVDVVLTPMEELSVTLQGAGASRHNAWQTVIIPADTTPNSKERTDYQRLNESPLKFPSLSDITYSPYWEASAHAEYDASEDLTLGLAVQRRDNRVYREGDGKLIAPHSEDYTASTLMLEGEYAITNRHNLHAIFEVQDVFDTKKKTAANDSLGIKASDGNFNNVALTLEFTSSPKWSVAGRFEYTTTESEQGGQQLWGTLSGTYRIGDAHTLSLEYGSTRAGIVCTGGVCRLVNSFTGFRIGLVSKL